MFFGILIRMYKERDGKHKIPHSHAEFPSEDVVAALHDKLKDDKKLQEAAQTSDPQVFAESIFPKTFDVVAQDSYVEQTEAFTSLFQNKSKYKAIMSALGGMLYREFNKPRVCVVL